MLTKTIKVDGQELKIAQLNMCQVEEILYGEKPEQGDGKGWNDRAWKTIQESLNNALLNNNDELPEDTRKGFDISALKKVLSFPGYNTLLAAVMEFSGLRAATTGEQQPSPAPALTLNTSGIDSLPPGSVPN